MLRCRPLRPYLMESWMEHPGGARVRDFPKGQGVSRFATQPPGVFRNLKPAPPLPPTGFVCERAGNKRNRTQNERHDTTAIRGYLPATYLGDKAVYGAACGCRCVVLVLRGGGVSLAEGVNQHVGAESDANHSKASPAELHGLTKQYAKSCGSAIFHWQVWRHSGGKGWETKGWDHGGCCLQLCQRGLGRGTTKFCTNFLLRVTFFTLHYLLV